MLYGMKDVLSSAGRDWRLLMEQREPEPVFDVRVVSATGKAMVVANDVPVLPDGSLGDPPDVAVVPEVMFAPDQDLSGRYTPETGWLQRCHAAHTTVATVCSGALLLAEAGLLRGREATTHWLYCEALSRYPDVHVHPHRALVQADGGRILMAGGGTSWHDLALFLVARFASIDEAMGIARLFLIDWHQVGQQPFASLACNRRHEDAVITDCQTWIAAHYEIPSPVQAMIQRSNLSERSFTRRFKQATGMAPMAYVHTLRIEESKHLLETTRDPVDAVAEAVGYEDASFFGRLFRRQVGLTPTQYRKRFGGLRRSLQGEAGYSRESAPGNSDGNSFQCVRRPTDPP